MIYQDEVTTAATFNGASYQMAETTFKARLNHLDDKRRWTLTLLITPYGDTTVAVQGTVATVTTSKAVTFVLDTSRPVDIEIISTVGTRITPTLTVEASRDAHRFALMAYLPLPRYRSAVLGSAIVGSFTLPDARLTIDGTILGRATLGQTVLSSRLPTHGWQNVTAPGTHINVTRGVDFNGFTSRADVGTLTFEAFNAHAPAASSLTRGTRLKLIDALERRPIFTGAIDSTTLAPEKDGTYRVTITALDTIAELTAVAKYQDTSPSPRTWWNAIAQLIDGDFNYTITATQNAPLIGNIVKDSTLTDYLDLITATVGAHWHTDKAGNLVFTDALADSPVMHVSDSVAVHDTLPAVSPIEINAAWDSSAVISAIEALNNLGSQNTEGEWTNATQAVRVTNATNAVNFGARALQIETVAATTADLHPHVAALIARYEPVQGIKSARFAVIDDHGERPELAPLLTLDILDPVRVSYRHAETLAHIAAIHWDITPARAHLTLDFINRKDA